MSQSAPIPPTNSSIPGWLLLLLLAVGGPTAAAATFANPISSNPLQFTLFTLIYLLVLALVGLLTKVWQNLEPRWVGPIANWIDSVVHTMLTDYHQRYLTYLTEQHRFFDVKGLTTQGPYSLRLEQVFVELSLAPETAQRSTTNPIAIPTSLNQGQHTLWDFLRAPQLQGQHLVILGAPGSGKTTLLRHMALAFSARGKQVKKLPILLFLRDHASTIKDNPALTLAQAIRDHLTRLSGPLPPSGWFERQLHAGKCLVMLDGLDEVAEPTTRKLVVEWVERQMTVHAKNRFLITSRPFGYRNNPLERVALLEVRPFTHAQVERFIHNWYLANEIMSTQCDDAGVRRTAKLGAEDLLQRLHHTPSLADLAVNPLLLTMIANVHRYRSSLPGRRVELYAEIFEVFLGKRRQARGIDLDLTPAQKQSVLQPLAYAMMHRQQREITTADILPVIREPLERVSMGLSGSAFVKQIEESSGLLLERENGIYSFAHLTFQEYLAAAHAREQRLEAELMQQVAKGWWHETLRLYSAQADATAIINACITNARPAAEALTLAMECAEEARQIEPLARRRLDLVVNEGLADRDPARRTPIAEALLTLRLRNMVQLDDQRMIDTAPLSCAEYQLFLDKRYAQKQAHQPDHWNTLVFPADQARSPIVGLRYADAQAWCDWLSHRESGWRYRLPTAEELDNQPKAAINAAPSNPRYSFWLHGAHEQNSASSYIPTPQFQQIINQRLASDWQQGRLVLLNEIVIINSDAHTLTGSLEHMLVIAQTLAQALADDLPNNVTRKLAHNLDSVCSIEHIRDQNYKQELTQARNLARNLARDLDTDRLSAHDHTSALALARARALTLALTFIHDFTGTHIPQSIIYETKSNVSTSSATNPAQVQYQCEAKLFLQKTQNKFIGLLIDTFVGNPPTINVQYHHNTPYIDAARSLLSTPYHEGVPNEINANIVNFIDHFLLFISSKPEHISTQQLISYLLIRKTKEQAKAHEQFYRKEQKHLQYLILLILIMLDERLKPRFPLNTTLSSEEKKRTEELRSAYQDAYISLAVLEERIAGNLPAVESILLVRERTKTN